MTAPFPRASGIDERRPDMKAFSIAKKTYTIGGADQTNTEIHLFKLTILVYRKVKNADKRIRAIKDSFFGTGTLVEMFLPF